MFRIAYIVAYRLDGQQILSWAEIISQITSSHNNTEQNYCLIYILLI